MNFSDKCDQVLGKKVVDHLHSIGMLGSEKETQLLTFEKLDILESKFREVLDVLGMNLEDPNLVETPKRLSKLWVNEMFYGMDYHTFPKITVLPVDSIGYNNFVLEKNVTASSCCSHHFVPMIHNMATVTGDTVMAGGCSIAYIPNKKIIGLSKLNRVVEWAGKRPQCQEQYCRMVVEILKYVLDCDSVACKMNLQHLCVSLRGAADRSSSTTTLYCSGLFETDKDLRREFLEVA